MAADRLMLVLYDGNLPVSSWLLFALTWVESAQRRRHHLITPNRTILAAPLAMPILFTIIAGGTLVAPQWGYFPLFAMMLTALLRLVLIRQGLRDRI